MSVFGELKRRNVFRVGVAYLVTAWLLLQLVDVIAPILEAPEWVPKAILLLLVVGFPLALVLAWAFELTPEGLRFERDVDPSESMTRSTGRKLDFIIIGILSVAVAFFSLDKFVWSNSTGEPEDTRRAIAVLPFANMSGDPEQVYFSDGITEEILNALVRVPGISVASRTSSFNYRGDVPAVATIAEELGVLFVLEGSVRKSGDQVRITAQLIDGLTDRHLWSETYDRELKEIFAIQSDIATQISRAIRLELGVRSAGNVAVRTRTENMNAYDLYLRGNAALARRTTAADLLEAIDYLEQAVAIDPQYAEAWAVLAASYSLAPYWVWEEFTLEEGVELADQAAARALAINPDLALAIAVQAARYTDSEPFDLNKALELFESAIARDPLHPIPHHWLGHMLLTAGYFEEAVAAQQRCLDIDPKYPNCLAYLRFSYNALGRHDLAREVAEESWEYLQHDYINSHLVAALLLEEERSAAILAATQANDFEGAPRSEWIKALENPYADHSAGLRRYEDWAAARNVDLEVAPGLLAALGAYDRVRIKDQADVWFFYWLPMYKPFRASEPFKDLIRRNGIYDLWLARGFPDMCRAVGDNDFECD